MGDWRSKCRECGTQTVENRAWCSKHLRMVRLGHPTDEDDIPEQRKVMAGGYSQAHTQPPR
jgi:hypothetical protein